MNNQQSQQWILPSQIQRKATQLLQLFLKDVSITPIHKIKQPIFPLFTILSHPPPITIIDLRSIIEYQGDPNYKLNKETIAVAQRMYQFVGNLSSLLQSNEQCRLRWVEGVLRGRADREPKVNARQLETQKQTLQALIEQCQHGITCKSQFLELIIRRRRDILVWNNDHHILKQIQSLQLPEVPQYYDHINIMNEQTYISSYEAILQKLLVCQNSVGNYLKQKLSFRQFQQLCLEHSKPDSPLLYRVKFNELIKFTLHFCKTKFQQLQGLRNKICCLRSALIRSAVRVYYLAFISQQDIKKLDSTLRNIEERVANAAKTQNSQALVNQSIHTELTQVQMTFKTIFSYLTDNKQSIFPKLFSRKIKKRALHLIAIQDRISYLYKFRSNFDYIEQSVTKLELKTANTESIIEQKFKQLEELIGELRPLNDNQFRVAFEEIQRTIIFVGKDNKYYQWREKLLSLEASLIHQYIFDQNGYRMWTKKPSLAGSLVKSRVTNGLNRSRVSNQEVFEENYQTILKNSSLHSSQVQERSQFNKLEVYQEGKTYISSINAAQGESFFDQTNFKVYLLPKLTRKVQKALKLTNYSVQPLYSQLTHLLESLRLIPFIIKPQINQQKLTMMVYPKIDSNLLSAFIKMMRQNKQALEKIELQLRNDPIRSKAIEPQIKSFIECRKRFLYVLLQNMDRLEEIAQRVNEMQLAKESYDVTAEGTYSMVLTLLLAEKEVNAFQLALQDRMYSKALSQKAFLFLIQHIYPSFLKSLPQIFQKDPNIKAPHILQTLLELCQQSMQAMVGSHRYMSTAVRILEDLRAGRFNRNLYDLIQQFETNLQGIRGKLEFIVSECGRYANINHETVQRQIVRVEQFLQICQKRSQTSVEIVDERSIAFLKLIKEMIT